MLVVTSTYFYTIIFMFHFACDWRANVTQLFLCLTFRIWMSTLIYQSQKLSIYMYTNKRLIFHMYMWIIFEIGRLK